MTNTEAVNNTTWRLLEMDVNSYAEATMSLSPAIAKACEHGEAPETLVLFTHRQPSIVMGRQNDPAVDINYDYCLREEITVKRVPTPGTIFGHPGYIMNALYIHRSRLSGSMGDVFATINNQLANAFTRKWGVDARHRPLNDLEVIIDGDWKKIGPFSISFFGPLMCCRVGLTITPIPFDVVEASMPGPPEKFSDKKAKSVSTRVGSLTDALGRDVNVDEVKEVVKNAYSELFQVKFEEGSLSELEKEYERQFLNLYDNEDWFWANSVSKRFPEIPAGASLYEHVQKIPGGPLIRARVLKTDTKLIDCSLTGWYHGVKPLDALERIESHLKDISLKEEEILSCVEKAYQEGDIEIDQCPPTDLLQVIVKSCNGKKLLPV